MRILMPGLLLLALPAALAAQVDGVVVDGNGQPVEGATVELWRPLERAAVRLTGADGAFRFREDESAGASALYVTRLGFAPLRATAAPGATGVRLVLTEARLPLPELVVETATHVCPNEESGDAVALWRAASAGYVPVEEGVFVGTRLTSAMSRVEIGDVGVRPARASGRGERGSAGSVHAEWRERIRKEGYAWPLRASSLDGRFEAWEYPRLESDLAGHFADTLFLELHTLSVVRADEDGWVLGFCPRPGRGDRPVIEGTITLAPDTTFASAEWRFWTGDRFPENAGGKVMFTPRGGSPASSYLLPIEGWYWRATSFPDRFVQHWQKYEAWQVGRR